MNFDFSFALKILPIMFKYVGITLSLALISIAIGLFLSIIISATIYMKIPILSRIFKIHISFFRGTPLIAQLFCVYFGVIPLFPKLSLVISSFNAAVFVMSLNSSAYMAESLRGALNSVEKGQIEASLSIGMTYFQTLRRIIFPQAFRIAIPTLFSSFINVLKDTALTFSIGVKEIMAVAQLESASSYRYLEGFVDVLIIYWILTSILTFVQGKLEVRLNKMVKVG